MKSFTLFAITLDITLAFAAAPEIPDVPEDAVEYKRDGFTQSIFRLDERPTIQKVKVTDMSNKDWHQSGGMLGVEHTSRKFRTLPPKTELKHTIAFISVLNSFGFYQNEQGVTREYPDGTRFDDVLYNADGRIFEHRVREKKDGEWKNRIAFSDKTLRPAGYTGLKQSCSSCHDRTGTGGYAEGLVPGGDGVFSDPLDWSLVK